MNTAGLGAARAIGAFGARLAGRELAPKGLNGVATGAARGSKGGERNAGVRTLVTWASGAASKTLSNDVVVTSGALSRQVKPGTHEALSTRFFSMARTVTEDYDSQLGLSFPDSRLSESKMQAMDRRGLGPDVIDTANAIMTGEQKVRFVNTTKRDGSQSNDDCRMTPEHLRELTSREIDVYKALCYPDGTPLFVGEESRLGGNTFRADACVNGVNPYYEANLIREMLDYGLGEKAAKAFESRILFRGMCGAALAQVAKDVIAAHVKEMADNGVTQMKIFWALNYTAPEGSLPPSDYYKFAIQCAKDNGMKVEFAIAYHDALSMDQVARIAEHGLSIGADSLAVKDMGSLIAPMEMYNWVKTLMQFGKEVAVHTHFVTHMGISAYQMAVWAGARVVDTCWSGYGGANGQPALEPTVAALGLSHLLTPAVQAKLNEVNDYCRQTILEDLAAVQTSNWTCEWDVMNAKLASGAIAHVKMMLQDAGKSDLFRFVYERVAFVREYSGNPPLVTPTALYNTNQVLADLMSFEARVKLSLKESGIGVDDFGYRESFDRRMWALVRNEPSPTLTDPIARLVRGDFGLTPVPPNPETKATVLRNYMLTRLEGFPFESIPDETKAQICDGILALDEIIIASIRDEKGLTYDDYLDIKKGAVSDAMLLSFIREVPALTKVFNSGLMPLALFKKVLPEGLTSIGDCTDWMPDGMPPARDYVKQRLADGWTLPPNTSLEQMAILRAKFGDAVNKFFEKHENREEFALPKKEATPVEKAAETSPAAAGPATNANMVTALIDGAVLTVKVKIGDRVEEGDPVAILHAMKMETVIPAPKSGVVEAIFVAPDDQVKMDQPLLEIK